MTKQISIALAVALAGASHATVLTFGDLKDDAGAPLGNYGVINHAYGDHVTSTNDGVGSYDMGSGWTPNVVASYESLDNSHNHFSNNLLHWVANYGDLEHVAFCEVSNGYSRLILNGENGKSVKLESFDVAGYYEADLAINYLQIRDGSDNVLWDSNATVIHGTGKTHDHYTPDIVGQTLVIEWGTNWNTGLDNVSFSEVDSVPEPTTMVVLGLAALVAARRQKSR